MRSPRSVLRVTALALAFGVGMGVGIWPATPNPVTTGGAAIRLGPSWGLHTNAGHAAPTITGVTVNKAGNLVITRKIPAGSKIVTCVATPDETLLRLDVQAGCSGGGATSVISLYSDGRPVSARSSRFGATANVWVSFTTLNP